MAEQPLNQRLSITQGVTAQTWAAYPPVMAENDTTLGNVNDYEAIAGPNPEDARPGYLAAGQPGGANVAVIPSTDANGASGANLQTVGPNAGTAGGGGYYPAAKAGAVPNPMVAPGWNVQANGNDPWNSGLQVAVSASYPFPAATAESITPTITGGTSPYTVTLLNATEDVAGVITDLGATEPTGFSVAAATGVITLATTTVAGTYNLTFKVVDSANFEGTAEHVAEYTVTVVLT